MKRFQEKGITLIALVVTIIILLILAGVTIGGAMNGSGLFDKAKEATQKYQNAKEDEENQLSKLINQVDSYIDVNSRDTVTISKEEYEKLKKKGTWELIASSTTDFSSDESTKTVSDLSKYSSFVLYSYYDTQYLATINIEYNLFKTDNYFFASYSNGGIDYFVGVKYISDTKLKLFLGSNSQRAELYGIY